MHFVGRDRIERRGKASDSLLRVKDAPHRIKKTLLVPQFPVGTCQECCHYPSGNALGGEEKSLLKIRNRLSVLFVLAQFITATSVHLRFQLGISMLLNDSNCLFEEMHADPQLLF